MSYLNIFAMCLGVALLTAWNFIASLEKTSYEINKDESELTWIGRKIAYSHNGTLDLGSGELQFQGNQLVGGAFTIDMTSIQNVDIDDDKDNAKLVGHLKSKDFFYVKKFPEAQLVITKVTSGDEANTYDITGDLTIKGITHPVNFPAKIEIRGEKMTAEANIVFDRSKYDVRFQSGSFFENLGDKVIYDDVEIGVKLVGKKNLG